VSGSQAFENLKTTISELSSSQGIVIEKPGSSFREPSKYAYSITPYIFGRAKHEDEVDAPKLEGDIQTWGPLQAAFVADPLLPNSGAWWRRAYSKAPDVALNHPARWVFAKRSDSSPPLECVGDTCVSPATSNPRDPWFSDFHHMRGFFISKAVSPGQGPQLSTAPAGDKLLLETRVYNYSLVDMPKESTVQVRFYVQPMNKNLKPDGASRLIGQTELGLIPPFSDVDGAPLNSVLARTTFDPSDYADQYVAFWVVTWMQNANGVLVTEPEGHGLREIPGNLTSLADVKAEKFSNNVGFYKWLFYVAPRKKTGRAQAMSSEDTTSADQASNHLSSESLQEMQLTNLEVSSGQKAELDQEVAVSTGLRAGSSPIPGATVIFYDGDPKDGGQIFDMEHVPYVRANDTLEVEVPFRTEVCGVHDLYAVTYQGTAYEKVSEPFVLQIDCPVRQK